MGAVLTQQYEHSERPVAFISKTFTDNELKYTLWEKELFTVIWATKYFRPYLLHRKFTIRSDNKPSTQLITNHSFKLTTSATSRVIRWILSLQPYNFEIQHHPGKSNVVADALSRFPLQNSLECNTTISTPIHPLSQQLTSLYQSHPSTSLLWDTLQSDTTHPRYQIINDLIYTREPFPRILIPNDTAFRADLFKEIHDTPLAGHPGFHKLLAYVNQRYTGTQLRQDVLDFTRSCPECQKAKPRHERPLGTTMPLQPPQTQWRHLSMDLITQLPLSNTYNAIFVIVDRFSKMAHFIPTHTTADAKTLAHLFIDNIIRLHGFPRSIVSDRDSRFLSNFWREIWSIVGTTLRFSTANYPQTDGQTERTNRTLEQYLRLFARHRPSKWSEYLSMAEFAYNNATHTSTGFSPAYIIFHRHPETPLDIALPDQPYRTAATEALLTDYNQLLLKVYEHLDKARTTMIKNNAAKDHPPSFHIDDLVLIHRSAFRTNHTIPDLNKFDDRWFGPFPISKIINSNAYEINLPSSFKSHKVINITFLRPYRLSSKFPRIHPDALQPPPVESDANDDASNCKEKDVDECGDIYEVEAVLDCRLNRDFCKRLEESQRDSKERKTKRIRPNLRPLQEQLALSKKVADYEFLVKWKGYPLYDATWEPLAHLSGSPEAFQELVKEKELPHDWLCQEEVEDK